MITTKQLDRALRLAERAIPADLFRVFRRAGMDRDDVLQEARLAAWKWISREDLRFDLDDRLRLLPSRVVWDLRDLVRAKTGRRRAADVRASFEAIVLEAKQASAVVEAVRREFPFAASDAFAWNASLTRYKLEEARQRARYELDDRLAVYFPDSTKRAQITAILLDFAQEKKTTKKTTARDDLLEALVEVLAAVERGQDVRL